MFKRVLIRIRDRIRNRQYIMTQHARKEMNDDRLTVFGVEHAILTGECIRGKSIEGELIETIVKMSPTGKAVIMTVYKI